MAVTGSGKGPLAPDRSVDTHGLLSGELNHGSMYLVDPRAYAQRVMHPGAWLPKSIRRHLIARDRQPTHSRLDCLEAGLTGTLSTAYSRRRAKELEQAFRNGDVSYEDACLGMEQLDGEP